ncbi:hypothetical protein [Sphaerisporangium fuscum]|uniref:hypothetical protein n=1 Tax=Sphaerisporangium fuscum TaxID=2835868 RepID=UPI001BDCF0D1|nr:hypothetical protein [Sphaerisporangium fuscum]
MCAFDIPAGKSSCHTFAFVDVLAPGDARNHSLFQLSEPANLDNGYEAQYVLRIAVDTTGKAIFRITTAQLVQWVAAIPHIVGKAPVQPIVDIRPVGIPTNTTLTVPDAHSDPSLPLSERSRGIGTFRVTRTA